MQIQDLIKAYRAKSDEELLQLAIAPEHLTSEARLALESELSRRQVGTAERFKVSPSERDLEAVEEVSTREKPPERNSQGVGDFVAEVLRTYHSHFWLFFEVTAPAVIISTIAIIMSRSASRDIVRHLPPGYGWAGYQSEILRIWLVNLAGYFVSWMASALSFGAICAAMREIESGVVPSVADCIGAVRQRLGAFFRLSVLLFFLALVAIAAAGLLSLGVLLILHYGHFSPNHLAISFVPIASMGIAFLVLSRFGLAMPAVVLGGCRVFQAMLRSDELTEGEWLTLAAILAKSLIGGYVAAMGPFWLASWIIPANVVLPSWFPWLLTLASIIGVTVVEPTMFVGFAALYLRTSPVSSPSRKVFVRQLA